MEEAHKRGIRIITDLVMNHTSDQHPWFQESRQSRDNPRADWYVWSDSDQRYPDARIIFTDTERSNWAWDPNRQQYYWHRFFSHQPDLNYDNPEVQEAMMGVLRFWLDLGLDGFRPRRRALPVRARGHQLREPPRDARLPEAGPQGGRRRLPGRVLLAEANQWPADVVEYFGDGDECHMCFHFPLMPRMFMALRREQRYPITEILAQTPEIPDGCQWGIFLRNHDELTLEMVTDEERDYMWNEYAKDPRMKLNIGIRRRLAPLVENDRRVMELFHAMLFSLPGQPDPLLRRRDRDGRQRLPRRPRRGPHPDAVDARPQRRLLPGRLRPALLGPAHGPGLRLPGPQRRGRAAGPVEPAALAAADAPGAQAPPGVRHRHLRGALGREPLGAGLRPGVGATTSSCASTTSPASPSRSSFRSSGSRVGLRSSCSGAFRSPASASCPTCSRSRRTASTGSRSWRRPCNDFAHHAGPQLARIPAPPALVRCERPHHRTGPRSAPARSAAGEGSWPAALVRVDAEVALEGTDDARYQVLLGLRPTGVACEFLTGHEQAVLGEFETTQGQALVYDGLLDTELALALLRVVAPDRPAERVRPLGAEQSNTSLVYDDAMILKVFRRLTEGHNPEVEVIETLVEAGFTSVPEPLASWRKDGVDLAFLQRFLAGATDGWNMALTSLRELFADHTIGGPPGGNPGSTPPGWGGPDPAEAPGDFAAEAERIGEVTAELHQALARGFGTQKVTGRLGEADGRTARPGAGPGAGSSADGAWPTAPAASSPACGRSPIPAPPSGSTATTTSARCSAPTPAGSCSTSRANRPGPWPYGPGRRLPSRTWPACCGRSPTPPAVALSYQEDDLTTLGQAWEARNRESFMTGYRRKAAEREPILPTDPAVRSAVLAAFELDKALYEVAYERANRPDWAPSP